LTEKVELVKLNKSINVLIPDDAADPIVIDWDGFRAEACDSSCTKQIHDKASARRTRL
jgi:hypothetical protein